MTYTGLVIVVRVSSHQYLIEDLILEKSDRLGMEMSLISPSFAE